jgi:nitrite reductase (NADH) large subunit
MPELKDTRMRQKLVLIGNGMAGVACLEQALKHNQNFDVTVFGEETHVNYNRIMLSSVLAGEKDFDDIILNGIDWYRQNNINARFGVRVVKIDREAQTVIGDDGSVTPYDKIIIATGSSPFIPPIEGRQKEGVFVFRTLDDAKHLLALSGPGVKAAVIGGGLLGLEAARGLQVQGCEVTVVHLMDRLMERQVDPIGGAYLKSKIEKLGVRVLLEKSTKRVLGGTHVEGLEFSDGTTIEANLLVIAAGIRPNTAMAKESGLNVNRGIVVDDFLCTSDPNIYAVGECTEHQGQIFGLYAPLVDQGKVLAAAITGNECAGFTAKAMSTKLKIMGVEVFSAGEYDEAKIEGEAVRFEDPSLGIYKKLVLKDGKLQGVVLVGDSSDDHRYNDWLRSGKDLTEQRRHLLTPPPAEDKGLGIAQMADSETICGCLGVSKGQIVAAIQEEGLTTLSQVKDRTRASTGCGSCAGLCKSLLQACVPEYQEDKAKVLCDCVPFPQEKIREIIHTQKLKTTQDVLDVYGNGRGCEVCKPAISYLMDQVWCGDHKEDRSAKYINDRVHANIQKDGTFSVIPRMKGGLTTPAELRKIADVAEKYNVPLVKVTGSQRLDLLGVKKEDLPKVWEDLGMTSGQAYTKGVRMVKTCVGNTFCRFGTQDAMGVGVELETRLEHLMTPHKTKMAVVGCPRNCAEATVKDIGLVGQDGSWQVVVGGAAGKGVRKADLLVTVDTTEQALEASELFFQYYRENAVYLERTYDFVERLGIEKVRRETVYANEETRHALLDRLRRSKEKSKDVWLERHNPRPNQFVQIQPLEPLAKVEQTQ